MNDVASPTIEMAVPIPDGNAHPALRILVVDDQPDTALSEALLLGSSGHKVEAAQDGASALKMAQKFEPDVVILDIGMPGMNGWELAKLLREQAKRKKPFIVAITGHGEEEDFQHSLEVGINLHLLKPVDSELLIAILNQVKI
jgi:CheY-like chemotaxis protein